MQHWARKGFLMMMIYEREGQPIILGFTTKTGGRSFAVAAASLWNALPPNVKDLAPVDILNAD